MTTEGKAGEGCRGKAIEDVGFTKIAGQDDGREATIDDGRIDAADVGGRRVPMGG